MLKFKLSSEDFEKLSDAEKTFYAQTGDGYQLQVDGAVDKSKIDEFRSTNVDLLKQQEQFKGVDIEKYRKLEEQERKLRDKELIDKGEFDTLLAENTSVMKSDYEAKINILTKQLDDSSGNYNSLIAKHEIEGAATKAFGEHKINPDAFDSVMAQIKSKFSIDNGQVVAREGDNILTGADGNLTVSEFVASQPEIFKIQSNGGKGNGNDNHQHSNDGTAKRAAYAKLLG